MILPKTILGTLLLFFTAIQLSAQESIMKFAAVAPSQVDRYYPEQADLYMSIFKKKLKPARALMDKLERKSILTKKEQAKKEGLHKLITKYQTSYQGWQEIKSTLKQAENEAFEAIVEENSCYQITMLNGEKVWYHGMPERVESDEMIWKVYKKPALTRKKIIVKNAYNQWKRAVNPDCTDPNPEKCHTWCLVRIPEEVKWIKVRSTESCPTDYQLTPNKRKCYKEVKLESKSTQRKSIIKAEDLGREILISSWEEVKC